MFVPESFFRGKLTVNPDTSQRSQPNRTEIRKMYPILNLHNDLGVTSPVHRCMMDKRKHFFGGLYPKIRRTSNC